jgi:hypothetical protein
LSTHSYYQQEIVACDRKIRAIQKKLNGMAFTRLALFVALGYAVYILPGQFTLSLLIMIVGLVAAFIICINIYYQWKDERSLQEKLRFVNTNELSLLAGEANRFPDGAAFLDSGNYLDDLDIFGKNSLFHVLNRTTTAKGTAALAGRLREPLLDPDLIIREQQAIRTLAGQTAIRQLLTAHGLLGDGHDKDPDPDTDSLREWLQTPPRLFRHPWRLAAIALLVAFNLFGIYTWFTSNDYTFLLAGAIFSRLTLVAFGKYTARQHQQIDHKKPLLDRYAGILSIFNTANTAEAPVLGQLQARTKSAHTAIRRLSKISNYFDHRLNGLVNIFLSTFFLYDLLCVIALERWKVRNRDGFISWLEAVGVVEQLNSLATFAFNNPDYHYPSPVATYGPSSSGGVAPPIFIETTGIAHPLIPAARRIANDLTIGRSERLILVTGSNMSGKTTFLRTIGVNLLLAECGLPVCAVTFSFTPMHLLTSLRISDSLQEQTSYFMAELKKLQQIVLRLQTGAPALVLIDEILRGTNSEDKTHGSGQFIRKLLQYRCLSLFATHDLSLGVLEQEMPGVIGNYCFESVIEGQQLHFDYRLQKGIARNRNASFLMKKMDII